MMPRSTCSLLLAIYCLPMSLSAAVRVTNHEDNSVVRYPVVLLRGTMSEGRQLTIRNADAGKDAAPVSVAVYDGRFKALVSLSSGKNLIKLSTPSGERSNLTLTYQPQTNAYYVRLVWKTDNTGETNFATPDDNVTQDYAARFRTAAQLMQTFTAERMYDLGYGRKTFRLERDAAGKIIVHTLKAPKTAAFYYELGDSNRWWNNVRNWLNQEHPDKFAKNIVLAAYTRKDQETGKLNGHTALGGGNLGLFGSGSVFCWPRDISTALKAFGNAKMVDATRVHEDSAGRGAYWSVASTTIGATLHEMGHTFGLPHCKDNLGIMTRGFDHFHRVFTFHDPPSNRSRSETYFRENEEAYFSPISASFLQWSPWFQLDKGQPENNVRPRIVFDRNTKLVTVRSEAGIRWIGFWVKSDVYGFREFRDAEAPTAISFTPDEYGKIINGKQLSTITTMASNGRSVRVSTEVE